MYDNDNQNQNFSDIPALGDVQGLENYLNNETLAAQGLPVQQTPSADTNPTDTPAANTTPTTTPNNGAGSDTITLTREQLNAILAQRSGAPAPAQPAMQQNARASYTAQEQTFIGKALAQGYSLDQINTFLERQRNAQGASNPAVDRRITEIENYLQNQEYKAAEAAFINKLSDFGSKWGLSEQDLVTFGNEALKHGINIATGNVNLETVFRAVYPEQYAIRSRRMTPTSTSQIYGGTSIPESSRMQSSKLEDAYVDAFLKGAMPNQYAALNKK